MVERELWERRERGERKAVVRAAHDPSPEIERELGLRPESLAEQERWDRAALALGGSRLGVGELGTHEPPLEAARRSARGQALETPEELESLDLTNEPPPPADLDVGFDFGS